MTTLSPDLAVRPQIIRMAWMPGYDALLVRLADLSEDDIAACEEHLGTAESAAETLRHWFDLAGERPSTGLLVLDAPSVKLRKGLALGAEALMARSHGRFLSIALLDVEGQGRRVAHCLFCAPESPLQVIGGMSAHNLPLYLQSH